MAKLKQDVLLEFIQKVIVLLNMQDQIKEFI